MVGWHLPDLNSDGRTAIILRFWKRIGIMGSATGFVHPEVPHKIITDNYRRILIAVYLDLCRFKGNAIFLKAGIPVGAHLPDEIGDRILRKIRARPEIILFNTIRQRHTGGGVGIKIIKPSILKVWRQGYFLSGADVVQILDTGLSFG
jgi:hypothetical protein